MRKFIEKSIDHVRNIFPSIYSSRIKRGSYHFSIALERNRIICVGLNDNTQVNAKAYRMGKKLGIAERIRYPFVHAEQDMVGKLIGMGKLSSSLNIVSLRMNVWGDLKNARPCESCEEIFSAYSLNRIWYSNEFGEIETL